MSPTHIAEFVYVSLAALVSIGFGISHLIRPRFKLYHKVGVIIFVILSLSTCTVNQTAITPENVVIDTWKGLPIIPDGIKDQEDSNSYRYTIDQNISDVKHFYIEQMESRGWVLLGIGDSSTDKVNEAYSLWFCKNYITATVDMLESDGVVIVWLMVQRPGSGFDIRGYPEIRHVA
jgi:hypothetical protein